VIRSVGGALTSPAGIIGPADMPEISRFFGIVIPIYYKEHGVPHFHAKYSGQTGVFSIIDLKLIEGRLPKRVVDLVLERAFEHRSEIARELATCGRAGTVAANRTFGVGGNDAFREGREVFV